MSNEPVAWMVAEMVFTEKSSAVEMAKVYEDEIIPLYTHPAKHLSLQKVDGELVAVTYTDDEHRIIEVLWEKPPAKTLTDEEIKRLIPTTDCYDYDLSQQDFVDFARAILRKAQER